MSIINSFSTRLSIYILAITTLLFTLSFAIYFRYSSDILLREVVTKQETEIEQLTNHIDAMLSKVELSVESTLINIYYRVNKRGNFASLQRAVMSHNDDIYGAAIAFEPYKFKSSSRNYMQYSARGADGAISSKMIGDDAEYDYHTMSWYSIPKLTGKPYWSEPYFDDGAGDVPMTTYSVPLFDNDGEFIGVVTADVSLKWITRVIAEYKPYPNSYSYMLSKSGYYISHEDESKVLNETFFSATESMHNETITEIGREMLSHKSGNREFMLDGDLRYAFYTPIERAGWSVGTVSFRDDIFMEIDELNRYFWITIACGLLLIFSLVIWVIYRATRPLVMFAHSADEISRGDFDAPLPLVKSRDEMYRLREAFSNMQTSLKSYTAELQKTTAARERIESELSIATEIQMGMLPTIFPPYPDLPNLDMYATLIPAKAVGGDLYDFFSDGDTLYFTVGDASGKGVPASLLMAVTSSLFRSMAKHLKDPAKVLQSMNNSIAEKNDANMFITLFVGAMNVKTRELLYSSAGHNAPVLIRSGEAKFIDVNPNLPLGVMSDIEFSLHRLTITPEDMLFLYSDGLTEAENGAQELYSNDRLLELLSSVDAACDTKEALQKVMLSIDEFVRGNEQSDDLTMLAVKLKPE